MKTIMARTPHESSFSFSRRYFHWKKNDTNNDENDNNNNDEEEVEILTTFNSSSHHFSDDDKDLQNHLNFPVPQKNKKTTNKISKQLLSALSIFGHRKSHHHSSHHHRHLGTKVVGTLFGHRRGHVHFAFQEEAKLSPAFLIELAMPTSVLVREMASGLVRIALECEKKTSTIATEKMKPVKLIEEPVWRTYCNGKKCGFASRIECGPEEWKVLRAVGPISMGAGVLPGCDNGGGGFEGEIMYMRARFERVVGSKDSEAFYMMNPDGSGGPELSIYLLRV